LLCDVFNSMNKFRLSALFTISIFLSGCFFTKVVTVPMRVTGAVISVVPIVGDPIDETIDTVADGIDLIPL